MLCIWRVDSSVASSSSLTHIYLRLPHHTLPAGFRLLLGTVLKGASFCFRCAVWCAPSYFLVLFFCLSRQAPAMGKGYIALRWSQRWCSWWGQTRTVSQVPGSVCLGAGLNTSSCTFLPSPSPASRALLPKGEREGSHPHQRAATTLRAGRTCFPRPWWETTAKKVLCELFPACCCLYSNCRGIFFQSA